MLILKLYVTSVEITIVIKFIIYVLINYNRFLHIRLSKIFYIFSSFVTVKRIPKYIVNILIVYKTFCLFSTILYMDVLKPW